ncbi:MAG: zf-HC2 domain-containing protein [Cyanobacteria bacterium SIG31]|nr:zf-HC2 domain-containing protein [Cyanobacteria bacterium SIG31]
MKLTCAQMDVLISFYIDGDLSSALKKQVEEHIKNCPTCKAKFEIIHSMLKDLKENLELEELTPSQTNKTTSQQYRIFKNNLSAYIDNELSNEESLKIKKFTINNKKARKELEDSYNIRRLMNESFSKTKNDAKKDFSKNVLRQLELEEEATLGFHPVIKLIIAFTLTVLILTTFVLISLNV